MAFRATPIVVSDAFDSIRRQAFATKQYMQGKRAQFVLATTSSIEVVALVEHCAKVLPLLANWAATPGIATYAQQQENDPTYDVVAEYTAMRNAIINLRDNLVSTFPKDASGFLIYEQYQADGSRTFRTFTAAQLANAVTLLDAAIATIN